MEPRFELRCLGDPVLLAADGQAVRIRVRKHLALLIYLVVERGSRHRREHLADLLWPNLSENDGKHSVATAVTMLRAAFGGDALDSSREGLQWSFTNIVLDLDRLGSGDVLGDESGHGPLHVALLLEGLELPGATEYMLWRERQRASWLPKIRDALVVLMDRCRRTGDSRQIELMADRMLALDDLSEEAIRAKMEAQVPPKQCSMPPLLLFIHLVISVVLDVLSAGYGRLQRKLRAQQFKYTATLHELLW